MAPGFGDPTSWWDRLWPCYSCCRNIWIPSLAAFDPQCLGVIGHIPLWVALLTITLRYGFGPIWNRYRPGWLRRFAAEEHVRATPDDDQEAGASPGTTRKVWSRWTVSLLLLSVFICVLDVVAAIVRPGVAQAVLISVVPSLISGLLLALERPMTAPRSILLIQGTTLLVNLALYTTVPGVVGNGWSQALPWAGNVILPFLSVGVILNMPLRDPRLGDTGISKPFAKPTSDDGSPEDLITLWQWMTVSWATPLMRIGKERQIHPDDVWRLSAEFQHSRLHMQFRELKGSVLARLLQANGLDLVLTTSLGLLKMALDLADPVLLKLFLGALAFNSGSNKAAITYAVIAFLARKTTAQLQVFNIWISRRAYERCRGELITMVYEKALRRKAFTFPGDHPAMVSAVEQEETSSESENESTATTLTDGESQTSDNSEQGKANPTGPQRLASGSPPHPSPETDDGPSSTGRIINLVRGDIYDVAQRFWDIADITTKPLTFILSVVLIWNILGPAALSGVLILIICMVINAFVVKWQLRVETDRRKTSDRKQECTGQFVEHIRHLRWYDWQDSWLARIMKIREEELIKRVRANLLAISMKQVSILGSYLFPAAAFLAYTMISKRPLTVDIAFPALNLFDMLQNSLSAIPDLVKTLMNSRISMQRIEKLMSEPDKEDEDWEAWDEANNQVGPPGELEISMTNASFSWPQSPKKVLEDVSFSCRPGLTMVCGKVGIGKSALLQSILGELDQHGGNKTVPQEMIGYCTQTPWLENMSIRDNIIFSGGYDSTRYEQVIDACCLREDFSLWKAKDLSFIGENGVGLSGGQKARVALARAIYSRARVLLLDDPIAALDHHTATSIMQNLFADKKSPLMADRLVIFVTHRVDIVKPYAYQVIEVNDDGRVETLDIEELENSNRLKHLAAIAAIQQEVVSSTDEDETEKDKPENIIEEEHRAHGGISAGVYWRYLRSGKFYWWATAFAFFILYRLSKIGFFWFVKEWGERYKDNAPEAYSAHAHGFNFGTQDMQHAVVSQQVFQPYSSKETNKTWFGHRLPPPDEDVKPWLLWFLILSLAQFFAMLCSDVVMAVVTYVTGKTIFGQAMRCVANATFRFYDVTPVGRLMNRLTSDMNTVDGGIAVQFMSVTWAALGWVASITVIATVTPPFLVISMLMSALFAYYFFFFLPASQSLRRLESVSLSPLFSNFANLLTGLTTVRAFRAQPHFQARNIVSVDDFQRMDHFYWSLQAWLEYRYVILSALTTFTLTLTAIYSGLSSGVIAFVLASASNFVRSTQSLCKSYGTLQMEFVSVERIIELLGLDQEAQGSVLPPAAWPHYGDDIVFDHVTLRYAPHLEPVLKDVTLTIPGGSNVAVTGRTGSGKTTLVCSLLSTLQPDPESGGTIHIGSVDLATVDKHALRRNITFVAQDPVLFSGTLRDNLDPTNEKTDEECGSILEQVFGEGQGELKLHTRIDGGGKNLSQGQRQLVGLARAILRRSPVVIMDEATASIDRGTAARIQRVLREELKQSTVITIAHRVEAVADADFEIVLERGKVVKAGPRGETVVPREDEGSASEWVSE